MKKFITNIKTLAALLMAGAALTACSSSDDTINEIQQPANPTDKYTMTINASKGDDAQTRALFLDESGTKNVLNTTWDEGEEVLVYQNGSEIGTLTAAASDDAETTLSGTLDSAPDASKALTFYFHTAADPSYGGQDGTLTKIASTYDFCAPATVASGSFTVNTVTSTVTVPNGISFGANQQAIVKFTLIDKASGNDIKPTKLTITGKTSNQEDGFEVNKVDQSNTITYGDIVITPSGSTNVIYAALKQRNPGGNIITLTAETASGDVYTYTTPSLVSFQDENNDYIYGYYEITVKMMGGLCVSGKFSVSSTKQVYFSKGNLQASYDGAKWKWHFGPNQYARVGTGANVYINGNGTVSDEGKDKNIDLFGWSTGTTYLGINNSTNNGDYRTGTITDGSDFVDWGSHADVIAGIGTGWRTLTSNEWRYLTSTRTTPSGKRFVMAQKGARGGMILLPDDWNTSYYSLNEYNDASVAFSANSLNDSQWATLEAHGAVFLPVTGQRSGTTVTGYDEQLHYWSSTGGINKNSAPIGNQMYVINGTLAPDSGAGRCNGFSVRLVRDVKAN